MKIIPFNKPYSSESVQETVHEAVASGWLAAGGDFTRRSEQFLMERYGFGRCLLTSSCTGALEMAAMLAGVGEGDEVIVPSWTYVSTALAFERAGARLRFADSQPDHPNIDASQLEELITERTKLIVPVHYGGSECDMERIGALARQYGFGIVEDAAHAINTSLGHRGMLSCFSFHETKNVQCGEGGMLAINDPSLVDAAEMIWSRGTNRAQFSRGQVPCYEWVSRGGAFGPSELTAAMLWANLQDIEVVQQRRNLLWSLYRERLQPLAAEGFVTIGPRQGNSHIFYLVCRNAGERSALIAHLASKGVMAVFHYQSLHRSPYGRRFHDGRALPHADRFSDCLVRLPLFADLHPDQAEYIADQVEAFYKK